MMFQKLKLNDSKCREIKLNILIITQYFYPENFRINEVSTELKERNHNVTVLTGLPNYPSGKFFKNYGFFGPYKEIIGGVDIIRVPLWPRGKGGTYNLMINYFSFVISSSILILLRISIKPDVIFVFGVSPITVVIPAILVKIRYRIPIIVWLLDLWPESIEAAGIKLPKFILKIITMLVKWIYGNCCRVLVQSQGFVPSLIKLGVDKTRISYLPNWIERHYEAKSQNLNIKTRDTSSFRIVYAGNIGLAQDFPSIINAAKLLNSSDLQVSWIIAGDGRHAAWVKDEVLRRGLADRFVFLGQLSPDSMSGLFESADALLVSLRSDPIFALTIPGKIQSYLTAGKPVLGMIDGEAARILKESGCGFVAPSSDYQQLAKLVTEISLMSEDQLKEIGMRAQNYARREFSRKLLFDKLELWLKESVDKNYCGAK